MRARTARKRRALAPLHIRGKFVHSHLSKELREKMKKRSIRVKKGDKVKILRGNFKGKEGKIVKVDLKECKIFIEGITRKKARGQEILVPIDPSNVLVTELAERK
jgi:large subunit ribosomal protein L24